MISALLLLLLTQLVASGSAASGALSPGRAEVQAGRLRWSPAAVDALHTVQVRWFEEDEWSDLPDCTRIKTNSCDVSAVIRDAPHGCVRLRVRAQSGQERSEAVEACGADEDRCTPRIRLSPVPGSAPGSASITVHLLRDHALWKEFADHVEQRVCHWREDRPEEPLCTDSPSSVTLSELDPGQTYCVTVQYLYFSQPEGLPRCPVCLQVPQAPNKHLGVALGVSLPVLALALGSVTAYVFIFHRKSLKTWLRPEQEPGWLTLPVGGAAVCSPEEEECDVISRFIQVDQD